jgi:hypothetical protein
MLFETSKNDNNDDNDNDNDDILITQKWFIFKQNQ